MLDKIEHVAIAVADLDASIAAYETAWGCSVEHREVVQDQGVEEAMLKVGESFIQLLCPTGPDTTVGRFLASKGEGLHHIAYEVSDISAALEKLKAAGARLIDETPRRGSRDTSVAFVHPKGNNGVLVELVQQPR